MQKISWQLLVILLLSIVDISSKVDASAESITFLPITTYRSVSYPRITTPSYYVKEMSITDMFDLGCNLADEVRSMRSLGANPDSVLSLLLFGSPAYQDGVYGVEVFGSLDFYTLQDVEEIALFFAFGYESCLVAPSLSSFTYPVLVLGVGVNNFGDEVSEEHGREWGDTINRINQEMEELSLISVYAVGSVDLELEFNEANASKGWVDGFTVNSPERILYNVGAIGGCPGVDVPGIFDGSCDTSSQYAPSDQTCPTTPNPDLDPYMGEFCWNQSDVWAVTAGINVYNIRVVPQIYSNNAWNAEQWYQMAMYGYRTNSLQKIDFEGVLSQSRACEQRPSDTDCLTLDNTPYAAWNQLFEALSKNVAIPKSLQFSTDIEWQNE